ncbi:hypothetical protein YPPY05_1364, partial [Yersinia pestis PY-05]
LIGAYEKPPAMPEDIYFFFHQWSSPFLCRSCRLMR